MKTSDTKILIPLFLLVFLISGCKTEHKIIKKEPILKYFESCYVFGKLPQSTTIYHINAAADFFVAETEKKGVTVYRKRVNNNFICLFTSDKISSGYEFSKTEIPEVDYILNAYMTTEASCITKINAEKNINIENGNADFSQWIKPLETNNESISFNGTPIELISFSNFLNTLSVETFFSIDEKRTLSLSIPLTYSSFDAEIVSAFRNIDFQEYFAYPGDFYISSFYKGTEKNITIRSSVWEKNDASEEEISSIVFPHSVLNSPYDEVQIVAFFSSLKYSAKSGNRTLPFINIYTKCGGFTADAGLFSVDMKFGRKCVLNKEELLLWFLTSGDQTIELDDRANANILSLKIAKKLYMGTSEFLGGSDIGIVNSIPDGSQITRYLFRKSSQNSDNIPKYSFYSYNGKIFDEFTKIIPLNETKHLKAFYGKPDKSAYVLAAIVYRGNNYAEIKEKIKQKTLLSGYTLVYEYSSQVYEDGWSSIVVNFGIENENDFISFFEELKTELNAELSLGVYRVPKKEY